MRKLGLTVVISAVIVLGITAVAQAAVIPGWECIPTTAGAAVTSAHGVVPELLVRDSGARSDVRLVGSRRQADRRILDGQRTGGVGVGLDRGPVNGEGNLIIGYAENAAKRAQSGSNDLIVGSNNSWSGYGQIVGGSYNEASGDYAAAFGLDNVAKGGESLTGGEHNTASGAQSSVPEASTTPPAARHLP